MNDDTMCPVCKLGLKDGSLIKELIDIHDTAVIGSIELSTVCDALGKAISAMQIQETQKTELLITLKKERFWRLYAHLGVTIGMEEAKKSLRSDGYEI